ncbi:Serine carboxypeptidase-like 20 isoform 4 [Tripterygium wilfordii]|uniref:Carboxypeptidase n=1 Tax=Tripterygium wilfordii TaxID=458696 RepID=A0A7J7DDE4_TRIWF|nr:Serine carboxypeptidase-like 20 isoform 4 [Tripterygium wilfordii]
MALAVIAMKKLSLSLGSVLCLALTRFAFIEAIHEGARIKRLPGFSGTLPSEHYSGYVEAEKDMHLFYYFVVSERHPKTDPVVLWLNGGPGCSSFDGFIYEHGPFKFKDVLPSESSPRLDLNPYSWSKVSNIIYLDSPVGVGLSYYKDETETKYKNDDKTNAIDTYNFLIKWFELYPEYVENPFYISGESYAGVYIPILASEIVEGIVCKYFQITINIGKKIEISIIFFKQGYMIGNGFVADKAFDTDVLISYTHGMGLISDDLFEDIQSTCKGKKLDREKCLENLKKAVNNDELAIAWLNNEEVRKAIHTEPGAGHRVPESKPKEALHFYSHWLEGKPI